MTMVVKPAMKLGFRSLIYSVRAAKAKADIAKQRFLDRKQCMSVLTADQLDKLEQLRDDWRQEKRQGRNDEDRPKFRGRNFGN